MPRRRRLLAACLVLAGCRAESRSPDSAAAPRDVSPATTNAPREVAAATTRSCGAPVIDAAGVGALRIGASVDSVRAHCTVLRDTVERRAEGQPTRVLSVVVADDTGEAEVVDGRVWRITVEKPGLRTADSLSVGTSLARLLAAIPDARGDHGEGGVYVTTRRCMSFLLSDLPPGTRLGVGDAASLRRLPPSTAVRKILVFGCRAPQ